MLITKCSWIPLGITTQRPITTVYPTIKSSTNKPTVTLEPHNGGKKSRLLFVANIWCYSLIFVIILLQWLKE